MAIQTINLTVPGGDTPRSANTKINANFSNKTHAASRLVGMENGDVLEVGAFGLGGSTALIRSDGVLPPPSSAFRGLRSYTVDRSLIEPTLTGETVSKDMGGYCTVLTNGHYSDASLGTSMHRIIFKGHNIDLQHIVRGPDGIKDPQWSVGVGVYTGGNTTIDSNKNIKTSSPVVRVFSDHLDKIHEANDLPIKYTRNGVGDYTIEGTTGLRENDWQIVIPKDDHDNQLIAFTIEDDNGTIRLKTYKRTFSMETFTFGPDLNSPIDITEGRWVDLHFNDLPQENLDDTQTEV